MSAYSYGAAAGNWSSFGTEQGPKQNPYYRYIRDNIRTGIA